jgi:hypothetical protein
MTELNALAFITLIAILFSLYQIAAIWLNVREIRRLRNIRYYTQTQLEFGVARHELLMLVGEEELASDSITFLFFYLLDTKVMRHPDRYEEIAKMMRESLISSGDIKESEVSKCLMMESQQWSPRVKEMVDSTISAMNFLMVMHSPSFRLIYTIALFILPIVKKTITRRFGITDTLIRLIGKTDSTLDSIVKSKEELKYLKNCQT